MSAAWIGVASANHVARGVAGGFMQLCHGKSAPLRRLRPGDRITYYAPKATFGGKDRLQAFVAMGVVREGDPYRMEMAPGFVPWRRDVDWAPADPAPIGALQARLDVTRDGNWGAKLRFGLVPISDADWAMIAAAMQPGLSLA